MTGDSASGARSAADSSGESANASGVNAITVESSPGAWLLATVATAETAGGRVAICAKYHAANSSYAAEGKTYTAPSRPFGSEWRRRWKRVTTPKKPGPAPRAAHMT